MQEIINIFIRSVFIDNMIFAFFVGMCSYLAVSKTVKTSLGLGAAVIFVQIITVPVNYLLLEYVMKPGALVEVKDQLAQERIEEMLQTMEDFDDVTHVFTNYQPG